MQSRPCSVASFGRLALAAAVLSSWIAAQAQDVVLLRKSTGSGSGVVAFKEIRGPGGVVKVPVTPPPLPSNMKFVVSDTPSSDGFMTISADGRYVILAGYDAVPGTLNVASTPSAVVSRVIARIDLAGNIDTTTSLGTAFSGVSVRSACSEDGSQFWVAGGNGGIVLVPFGGSAGTTISSGPVADLRSVDIANGQLYATSAAGATTRCVNSIGVGIPTTPGQTIAPLNGMASGIASPRDFWFADPQTVYVADDRPSTSGGGLQKWIESGGTWTLAYTLLPGPGTVTVGGVTGMRDQTGTTLWATTTEPSANRFVQVVDTGPSSVFATLATAAAGTVYCGVRVIRTPNEVLVAGTGCTTSVGIPTISTFGGLPVSGNLGFGLQLGNAPPFSPYFTVIAIGSLGPGFPLAALGAPGCANLYPQSLDILLSGFTDGSGLGTTPLALTPDSSLWGLVVAAQYLPLDLFFYPGFSLPLGATVGMQLTIGN